MESFGRGNSSLVGTASLAGMPSAKLIWPVIVAFAIPVLLIAFEATPIGLDFIYTIIVEPALLIAWCCAGLWVLIIAVKSIRRRDWKAFAASICLPLVVLLAGLQLVRFIHFCNYAGDVLYFLAERSSYVQVIAEHSKLGEPRLLVFSRGGMSWSSRGFVYDESDQILEPPSMQSVGWKARASASELSCGYMAQPLMPHVAIAKHWYVASFPC